MEGAAPGRHGAVRRVDGGSGSAAAGVLAAAGRRAGGAGRADRAGARCPRRGWSVRRARARWTSPLAGGSLRGSCFGSTRCRGGCESDGGSPLACGSRRGKERWSPRRCGEVRGGSVGRRTCRCGESAGRPQADESRQGVLAGGGVHQGGSARLLPRDRAVAVAVPGRSAAGIDAVSGRHRGQDVLPEGRPVVGARLAAAPRPFWSEHGGARSHYFVCDVRTRCSTW